MSTPIKITKLQRFVLDGSPYVLDRQVRNALPALLRLALAVRAEHDLMVRDEVPTPEELGSAAGEIDAALADFDFTNEEPSITFDLGIEDVRPIPAEDSNDGEGWDMGAYFRCGCLLEVEDALHSLLRCCSAEHASAWGITLAPEEPSA